MLTSTSARIISKTAIIDPERYPFDGLGQRSKDDLMSLISSSTMPTLVERLGGSSSSPAIVGKFAEALIPLNAGSG